MPRTDPQTTPEMAASGAKRIHGEPDRNRATDNNASSPDPQTMNEGLTPEQRMDSEVSDQVSHIAHAAWDKAKLGNSLEDAQTIYGREMLNALWRFVNADRRTPDFLSEQYKSLWKVAQQMADALRSAENAIKGREHTGFIDKALAAWREIGGE